MRHILNMLVEWQQWDSLDNMKTEVHLQIWPTKCTADSPMLKGLEKLVYHEWAPRWAQEGLGRCR